MITLAGAAPPALIVSRIFAFTDLRAFFFGVINTNGPLLLRFCTRRQPHQIL